METKKEKLIDIIDEELERCGDKYKVMYQRESTLQTKVIQVLNKLFKNDIWFTKVSDRYMKGVPDIIGCIDGKFFGLELKRDKGKPSKLQLYTIDAIERAGGKVCIVQTVEQSLLTIKSILKT